MTVRPDAFTARHGGDLALESSLAKYEEGVRLRRHCQKKLEQAKKKIEILVKKKEGKIKKKPFAPKGGAQDESKKSFRK